MEQLDSLPAEVAPVATAVSAPSFAVPSLVFDNRTPFAATQFDILDQHDAAFHVVVAKIGYAIGTCNETGHATLTALDDPAQLNTEDMHEAGDATASVLEESDFAPYKPRCDVIVNAVAYAPASTLVRSLTARFVLTRSGTKSTPGILIDKTLSICGPRWFARKLSIQRLLGAAVTMATLGLLRPSTWRLTKAQPLTNLPVRYEHALGGQCRIDSDKPAARKVPKKHRLPDGSECQPLDAIAHEACETNPHGKGFTRNWFLKAEKIKRIPAPQICIHGKASTVREFIGGALGEALRGPAGLGVIGRAWLPRRALIGKIEEKATWAPDEVPRLPVDFDYAYWNCAPADQQCDYLKGQEQFSLVNLCAPDSKSARTDEHGNTVMRLELPQQAMFVIAISHNSELTVLPLSLDTVVINPNSRRLDLVWRGHLNADGTYSAARLMHITGAEQIARMENLASGQALENSNTEEKGA